MASNRRRRLQTLVASTAITTLGFAACGGDKIDVPYAPEPGDTGAADTGTAGDTGGSDPGGDTTGDSRKDGDDGDDGADDADGDTGG